MELVIDVFNKVVMLIMKRINVTKEIISELKTELVSKYEIVDSYSRVIKARITKKIVYFINFILKIVNNIYQKEYFFISENSNFIDENDISLVDYAQIQEKLKNKSIQHFLIKSAGSYMLFQDIQRLREQIKM